MIMIQPFLILMTLMTSGKMEQPPKPKVIAHRGYWDTEGSAQNSIASLIKADSIGCYGTEFDVWITQDEVPVINHDADYNGLVIEETAAAELLQQKLSNGEHLPSLDKFLDVAKKLKIRLVLELKPHSTPERESIAIDRILQLVAEKGLADRVDYISFSLHATKELVRRAPKTASVQYLGKDKSPKKLAKLGIMGADYNYAVYQKHPQWLVDLKSLGMVSNVWTVNKVEQMQWCIDNGLDLMTTDAPELYMGL